MHPHSLAWYDMAKACFTQEQWYSNLRVTITTFSCILRLILENSCSSPVRTVYFLPTIGRLRRSLCPQTMISLFLQRVASELVEQGAIFNGM